MTKLWVNFATTGYWKFDINKFPEKFLTYFFFFCYSNPTPEWNKDSKVPFWSPASKFPLDYMQIGNENGNSDKLLAMKKDLYSESAEFWIKLRQKYGLKRWLTSDKSKDEL